MDLLPELSPLPFLPTIKSIGSRALSDPAAALHIQKRGPANTISTYSEMSRSNGSSSDTSSSYYSLWYPLNLTDDDERRPRRKTTGWGSKWVWPRDRGNGGRWSRLKDVCRGKGPDIFVTSQRSRGPCRIVWSNWSSQQTLNGGCYLGSALDNPGCLCGDHHQLDVPFWARRAPEQVYDFRSRRYCKPRYENWRHVGRDPQSHRKPIYSLGREMD